MANYSPPGVERCRAPPEGKRGGENSKWTKKKWTKENEELCGQGTEGKLTPPHRVVRWWGKMRK